MNESARRIRLAHAHDKYMATGITIHSTPISSDSHISIAHVNDP